jgi:hypothetical protein
MPRHWVLLGRSTWITLVVLTLGIFFASFPVFLAQLHTWWVKGSSSYWQITSEQAELLSRMGWSLDGYATFVVALTLASGVLYLILSTLIIWRRPNDRMALLVALLLVSFSTSSATDIVSGARDSLWQIPNKGLISLWQLLLVLVFSLFPSGRFVPRWTRWTLVVGFAGFVPYAFFPRNTLLHEFGWLLLLGDQVILAVAQLYRYRRVSRPFERQQTKWVAFGFLVPAAVYVGCNVLAQLFPMLYDPRSPAGAPYQLALTAVGICLLFSFPLSLGIAILRYRLWEIDTLINKALVYGLLTLLLTALYAGLILGLEGLAGPMMGQQVQPAVIVVSTLVIAALFGPLRQRLQHLIDRRFYRQKYHAEKILAAFSATLNNRVALEEIREQVMVIVQETMQPTHVSLWLCKTGHSHRSTADTADREEQRLSSP